jgi:hypothetical protein
MPLDDERDPEEEVADAEDSNGHEAPLDRSGWRSGQ